MKKQLYHHLQVEQDLWTRKDCQEAILNTGMMPSAWELDPTAICAGGVKGVYSMGSVLKMMSLEVPRMNEAGASRV